METVEPTLRYPGDPLLSSRRNGPDPPLDPVPPLRETTNVAALVPFARMAAVLRAHPVLCLMLLTPGIPEYLSGSSSPAVLVTSPLLFLLFLALNTGMYTGGVLLIREARVRCHLGWASVLALGAAYGILEEGFALTTLFDPNNSQVSPSTAGASFGVNWGWTSGILPFHAIFSVAIPIFLLDQALPELRGVPWLSRRALGVTVLAYAGTIVALGAGFALHAYWMGWPVFLGATTAVGALVALAFALPRDALEIPSGASEGTPRRLFLVGLSAFPAMILLPGLVSLAHPPIPLQIVVIPALWTAYFVYTVPKLGARSGASRRVAFVAGLIAPFFASGLLIATFKGPIGLPVVILVDLFAATFLWGLYRRARPGTDVPGISNPPTTAVA